MATTRMVNPSQVSATAQPMQTQHVYMMPVNQELKPTRIVRPVSGVRCLSIATLVIGAILIVLGIIAIVLKSHMSYIADPIWTGLLFMVTTGILGMFVYQKKNNFCMNIAFLVMTIISSVFAYQLMEFAFTVSMGEPPWGCYPGPGSFYDYYGCPSRVARISVGLVIGFCAIAALVLCILSCAVTCYGTFTCCYNCCSCCRNPTSPSMVQYSPHSGIAMAPVPGQGIQVMAAPQMIPQGIPQQQHLLIASPQQYPMYSPPAYMPTTQPISSSSPQAFMVTSNQQMPSGHVFVPPGNLAPSAGNPSNPPAAGNIQEQPAPATVEQVVNDKGTDGSQNWQTFQ